MKINLHGDVKFLDFLSEHLLCVQAPTQWY